MDEERLTTAMLSLAEAAQLLSEPTEAVLRRARQGALIKVHRGSAEAPAEFPAFQFIPTIEHEVHQCMQMLGPIEAYMFLAFVHADMAGLAPLEVLLGRVVVERPVSSDAASILQMEALHRRRFVLEWAEVWNSDLTSY